MFYSLLAQKLGKLQSTTETNKEIDNSLETENLTNDPVGDTTKTLEYQKPVLICYGDVRDITLGGKGGLGESGCECLLQNLPSGVSGPCPVVCS